MEDDRIGPRLIHVRDTADDVSKPGVDTGPIAFDNGLRDQKRSERIRCGKIGALVQPVGLVASLLEPSTGFFRSALRFKGDEKFRAQKLSYGSRPRFSSPGGGSIAQA
jgi:hypothetical protein